MVRVEQHEPTDACTAHCYSHNVDEPGDGYIRCFECGHLYRTAGELRRAYRREVMHVPSLGIPRWRVLVKAATVRASRVFFCQECIHDF